jgi:hypothetical protein
VSQSSRERDAAPGYGPQAATDGWNGRMALIEVLEVLEVPRVLNGTVVLPSST